MHIVMVYAAVFRSIFLFLEKERQKLGLKQAKKRGEDPRYIYHKQTLLSKSLSV